VTDEEKIARGKRWKAFFDEPEGLRDMLGTLRLARFAEMEKTPFHQAWTFANLAIAAEMAREMETYIQEIITGGNIAEAAKRAAERQAAIPDYKKRWSQGVAA
jgi:hypothetical protein